VPGNTGKFYVIYFKTGRWLIKVSEENDIDDENAAQGFLYNLQTIATDWVESGSLVEVQVDDLDQTGAILSRDYSAYPPCPEEFDLQVDAVGGTDHQNHVGTIDCNPDVNIGATFTTKGVRRELFDLSNDYYNGNKPEFTRNNQVLQNAIAAYHYNQKWARATFGPINSWDVSGITDMSWLFRNDPKFNYYIKDWDVSSVTDMSNMFEGATSFNQALDWDVSSVTSMSMMFLDATNFNKPLEFGSSTSNVKHMPYMFKNVGSFNQPLNWDTSKVTSMNGMFEGVTSFNQALSWDTSKVTRMDRMFYGASALNSPLSFDTSKLTRMDYMFKNAGLFNQPLSWDVGLVTKITQAFFGTQCRYRIPLGCADPAATNYDPRVVYIPGIHSYESETSRPAVCWYCDGQPWQSDCTRKWDRYLEEYGQWDPTRGTWQPGSCLGVFVGNGTLTLRRALLEYVTDETFAMEKYNHVNFWDVSGVTSMEHLFNRYVESPWVTGGSEITLGDNFNHPIGGWDVSNVVTMNSMFRGASNFNQELNTWDTSKVTNMNHMFYHATRFNKWLGQRPYRPQTAIDAGRDTENDPEAWGWVENTGWDTSKVVNMYRMFYGATSMRHPCNLSLNYFNLGPYYANDMFSPYHSGSQCIRNGQALKDAVDLWYLNADTAESAYGMRGTGQFSINKWPQIHDGISEREFETGVLVHHYDVFMTACCLRLEITGFPVHWGHDVNGIYTVSTLRSGFQWNGDSYNGQVYYVGPKLEPFDGKYYTLWWWEEHDDGLSVVPIHRWHISHSHATPSIDGSWWLFKSDVVDHPFCPENDAPDLGTDWFKGGELMHNVECYITCVDSQNESPPPSPPPTVNVCRSTNMPLCLNEPGIPPYLYLPQDNGGTCHACIPSIRMFNRQGMDSCPPQATLMGCFSNWYCSREWFDQRFGTDCSGCAGGGCLADNDVDFNDYFCHWEDDEDPEVDMGKCVYNGCGFPQPPCQHEFDSCDLQGWSSPCSNPCAGAPEYMMCDSSGHCVEDRRRRLEERPRRLSWEDTNASLMSPTSPSRQRRKLGDSNGDGWDDDCYESCEGYINGRCDDRTTWEYDAGRFGDFYFQPPPPPPYVAPSPPPPPVPHPPPPSDSVCYAHHLGQSCEHHTDCWDWSTGTCQMQRCEIFCFKPLLFPQLAEDLWIDLNPGGVCISQWVYHMCNTVLG
tara:strand:- start:3499 stop:7068 length:3570 start_codon:yes stop_codon:yes gene_type:complete